jgi:DDB1- and CUL4-associated factor 11
MSASQSPSHLTSEDEEPRTVIYDPTDPFWHDTEDDDDDMDYEPAPGESQDEDDEDGDINFHGKSYRDGSFNSSGRTANSW